MNRPIDAEASMLSQVKENAVDVAGAVNYFEQRIDILERNLMDVMVDGFKKIGVDIEIENPDGDD